MSISADVYKYSCRIVEQMDEVKRQRWSGVGWGGVSVSSQDGRHDNRWTRGRDLRDCLGGI